MRGWVIALVLLVVAGLGNYLFYFANKDVRVVNLKNIFPYQVDGWRGDDLQLKEYVYKILGSKNVLSRGYRDGDVTLFLSVVASDRDRRVVHPPDVCLKGGGVDVIGKHIITLPRVGRVNELILKGTKGLEIVWYVYAIGNRFYSNYYLYQLANLRNALFGKVRRSYLIRLEFNGSNRDRAEEFFPLLLSKVKARL